MGRPACRLPARTLSAARIWQEAWGGRKLGLGYGRSACGMGRRTFGQFRVDLRRHRQGLLPIGSDRPPDGLALAVVDPVAVSSLVGGAPADPRW